MIVLSNYHYGDFFVGANCLRLGFIVFLKLLCFNLKIYLNVFIALLLLVVFVLVLLCKEIFPYYLLMASLSGLMDYSSDEESDFSDSEINEYKEKPYEELKLGSTK